MTKIPYKPEKSGGNEDDYEIVSFEEFCDKPSSSKTDLLTLNDNINYRLQYEGDKMSKFLDNGSCSKNHQTETSLGGSKNATFKNSTPNSFAPFGKYSKMGGRAPLFSAIPLKSRNEGESASREHRYQRFSDQRNVILRIWDHLPGVGSGMLGIALICALCVGTWWAVGSAVGGAWEEEHYKKPWEKTHPENVKKPLSPMPYEKLTPEHRYHDHSNLSTRNKSNATNDQRKTEFNKKSVYSGRPAEVLQDLCQKVEENMRFDCYPQGEINKENCAKRGCCWKEATGRGVPYCYYPPQYDTFRFLNMTEDKHTLTAYYERSRPSGYPDDFDIAKLVIKYLSDDVVQIKITDAEKNRFEPPYPEISVVPKQLSNMKYRVHVEEGGNIGFKVIRNSDNVTIFDTKDASGGVILSDKLLQISAVLPTDQVFGLGEKRARFMNDMNWKTMAIFNRDRVPEEGVNLYGSQPYYMAVEHDGKTHGTLLLNSNAMDIVLQPSPGITYRTIGGVINLFVFLGPSPQDVIAQYTELVGRPFMPPYWSLGFHLCKFNYGNLNVTKQVWQSNRDAGIPFDVQWNDIDYMHKQNDFTYDTEKFAGLPDFVNQLHSEGMHYMIIIDPGISASEAAGTYPPYDRGIEMDVFIKNSTNQPFIGKVWNSGSTVFPDFTHPNSTAYWVEMMTDFHKLVPYDGAWIDMNEPSNFADGPLHGRCEPERVPYAPRTRDPRLCTHTLCMEARHHAGRHYDLHNLYSVTEAIATNFALQEIRGKRPFIISRANFVGLGRYSGHWSGDITSDWHDMKMTIPELLSYSLYGVPMMGADICGFNGNTTPELCTRWMQLGAFYPFSRNHNSDSSTPQDPVSLGPRVVEASRRALRLRYRLLPYYYTLFWRAHVYGDTLIRPLFFEELQNPAIRDIDGQFLVGPHVLVTAVLEPGARTARGYLSAPRRWYRIYDGSYIGSGEWRIFSENETVAVKGGGILPLQEPPARGPVSTTITRSSPLQLLVVPDTDNNAHGELYWDDGDSLNSYEEKKYSHIEFTLNSNVLQSRINWWGYGVPSINTIIVYNQPSVKTVSINDAPCVKPCGFTYTSDTRVLTVNVDLSVEKPFNVKWTFGTSSEIDPSRNQG